VPRKTAAAAVTAAAALGKRGYRKPGNQQRNRSEPLHRGILLPSLIDAAARKKVPK
jgi:hypothetical protein